MCWKVRHPRNSFRARGAITVSIRELELQFHYGDGPSMHEAVYNSESFVVHNFQMSDPHPKLIELSVSNDLNMEIGEDGKLKYFETLKKPEAWRVPGDVSFYREAPYDAAYFNLAGITERKQFSDFVQWYTNIDHTQLLV